MERQLFFITMGIKYSLYLYSLRTVSEMWKKNQSVTKSKELAEVIYFLKMAVQTDRLKIFQMAIS